MRKTVSHNLGSFIVLLIILVSCDSKIGDIGFSEEILEDNYEVIEHWFQQLCSNTSDGRYSGSTGIRESADFICSVINDDANLERVSFEGEGLTMENILYRVPGVSDSLIVFGAHYDAYGFFNKTPLPGADDNISGVAVLLNMIKQIQETRLEPAFSLLFCFFDGEEIGRYGSNYFIKYNKTPIKLYVNIDTCGSETAYLLTVSYNGSFPKLRDHFSSLPASIGAQPIMEYLPLGYTTDCEPFLRNHIPFIAIGPLTIPPYLHSPHDDVSHISFARVLRISNKMMSYLSDDDEERERS